MKSESLPNVLNCVSLAICLAGGIAAGLAIERDLLGLKVTVPDAAPIAFIVGSFLISSALSSDDAMIKPLWISISAVYTMKGLYFVLGTTLHEKFPSLIVYTVGSYMVCGFPLFFVVLIRAAIRKTNRRTEVL